MDNNLKKIRNNLGKKQEDVARDLGVSLSTYRSWEQGRRSMTMDTLMKLADYYEVTTDDILGTQYAHDGLEIPRKTIYETINEDEKQLLIQFRGLSEEGQEIVIDYIDTLVKSGKYRKKSMPDHQVFIDKVVNG